MSCMPLSCKVCHVFDEVKANCGKLGSGSNRDDDDEDEGWGNNESGGSEASQFSDPDPDSSLGPLGPSHNDSGGFETEANSPPFSSEQYE